MNQIKPTFRKGMIAAGILLCVPIIYGAENNPLASSVINMPGSVSDDNVSDRSLSVTQQAAIQTEAIRTYKDDIRDNLPPLAQPAAIEFCKAMESDFTAFSQNNDTGIKEWGDFLRHVIFQREMGISIDFLGSVVNTNPDLESILDVNCVSTSESKQYDQCENALRTHFMAKKALAAPYQLAFWKVEISLPFLTGIVGGTLIFITLKDEISQKVVQFTGATLLFISVCYNLFRALYGYWQSKYFPIYSQDQVNLSALYLAYTNKYAQVTAGARTQEFIDYLKDKSFQDKTLSQFALTFTEEK